ncbi:hypothetical protein HK405_010769, partial [Cladochytrium tenue]
MAWAAYKGWIEGTFQSKLAFDKAIQLLDRLNQRKSVRDYSFQFNNLVASLGSELSVRLACSKFRNGLKPELASHAELNTINNDLLLLQREAARLDDISWNARQGRQPAAHD